MKPQNICQVVLEPALAAGEHRIVWAHPYSDGDLNQMSDESEVDRYAHWGAAKRAGMSEQFRALYPTLGSRILGVIRLRPGTTRRVLSSLVATEVVACSCGRDQRSQVLLLPLVPLRVCSGLFRCMWLCVGAACYRQFINALSPEHEAM